MKLDFRFVGVYPSSALCLDKQEKPVFVIRGMIAAFQEERSVSMPVYCVHPSRKAHVPELLLQPLHLMFQI